MWGKCLELVATVLFVAAVSLAIIYKKKRKLWIVCAVLAVAASVWLGFITIEDLFYSFPSAEAVAEYACKGEVIEILNGQESSLILYAEKPGDVSFMLSNKTEKGYKIGTNSDARKHSRTIAIPFGQILVRESDHGIDQYICVYGFAEGTDVEIHDTQGNQFSLFEQSSTQIGVEPTLFKAFCLLSDTEDADYQITVNGTTTSIT